MRFGPTFGAAVAVMALAACGGDGEEVDPRADQEAADRAVQVVEDRAEDEGFVASSEEDDEDDELAFESQECRDFEAAFPEDDDVLPGETASADAASLEAGELGVGESQQLLEASVGFVETAEQLDELWSLLDDERLPTCLEEALRAGFEEDEAAEAAVDDLAVTTTDIEEVGDDTVAFEVRASLSAAGLEVPFRIDFALARQGRTAAFVSAGVIGEGEPRLEPAEVLRLLLDEAAA